MAQYRVMRHFISWRNKVERKFIDCQENVNVIWECNSTNSSESSLSATSDCKFTKPLHNVMKIYADVYCWIKWSILEYLHIQIDKFTLLHQHMKGERRSCTSGDARQEMYFRSGTSRHWRRRTFNSAKEVHDMHTTCTMRYPRSQISQ
jgi:hypothetical protein